MDMEQETTILIEDTGAGLAVFGELPVARLRADLAALGAGVRVVGPAESLSAEEVGTLVLLRSDSVYEKGTLRKLIGWERDAVVLETGVALAVVLTGADGGRLQTARQCLRGGEVDGSAGIEPITVADLGSSYNFALRKTEPPFAVAVANAESRERAERRIYAATYKGVTDLVTKYVWPEPAFRLTRLFLRGGIHPNTVTLVSAVFMLGALWLFWEGLFAAGLLCGWIMALLDTVDGKMARVGGTASKFGEIFDHGIDLLHPPFWYVAWLYGLAAVGQPVPEGWTGPIIGLIFGTYIGARVFEGYFIRRFGFHIHVWRRFDSFFREIVARRNPNLILLSVGTLLGRPDYGLYALVVWQCFAVVVHLIQTIQAEWAQSRGGVLRSWLQARAEAEGTA